MDFGIEQPGGSDHHPGSGIGTHLWRAPEVTAGAGKVGPASDAWGVGALAHWVIVDDPPSPRSALRTREGLARAARAQRLPEPVALGRHIAALLETDPANRRGELASWADQLDELLGTARWPLGGRRRSLAALIGCCGLAGVGVLAGVALTADGARHTVMLQAEIPEAWPGGRVGANLPIGRGDRVEMKCWTVGPFEDGGEKWFYVEATQFPYDEGYVPANSVVDQAIVPLCPPWTSPTTPPGRRGG